MKKIINIGENLYVNMESIEAYNVMDDMLLISTHNNDFTVVYDPEVSSTRYSKEQINCLYVPVQEFHRINREVCSFLEIDEIKVKIAALNAS